VPQSGWLHEPHPDVDPAEIQKELLQPQYTRSHRWDRNRRSDDELAINPRLEKMAKVLFSTDLEVMGLYDKTHGQELPAVDQEFRTAPGWTQCKQWTN